MTTNTLTPEQLEQLATEHAALADTIAQATARQKEIKNLVAHLGAGKHPAGPYSIQVTVPQKFDANAAQAAYPHAEHPEFYALTLDRKRLEHALPPATIDLFKTAGTPTVTIK